VKSERAREEANQQSANRITQSARGKENAAKGQSFAPIHRKKKKERSTRTLLSSSERENELCNI